MTTYSFDDDTVLFVFGPARGGTTYLANLLDDWFDYGMGPEGTFIKQFRKRIGRYGDLSNDSNLARCTSDLAESEMMEIMRHAWPEAERIDVTSEAILSRVQERSPAGLIFAALATVADLRGKKNLGTKEPNFWEYWQDLDELFGEKARYLCIVRDGRDVALSLFRQSWGEKSAYIAAKRWVQFLETVQMMRNKLPPERFDVIRYETLLTEPDYSVEKLEKITGAELTDTQRAEFISVLKANKYASNFNKWKESMGSRNVEIFESVAGSWLDEYNYERSAKPTAINVSEKVFYETEEVWRKVVMTLKDGLKNLR